MRICPKNVRLARGISALLPPLLRANLSLPQAQQELRWIQQELPRHEWGNAVAQRARKVPLQYILGTQPFGPLEIRCQPGVLIPRWETEEWVTKLCEVIPDKPLAILEPCTGSGCISLLLGHSLKKAQITAFDVSTKAVAAAKENSRLTGVPIKVFRGDLQSIDEGIDNGKEINSPDINSAGIDLSINTLSTDLLVANPPYIPLRDYLSSVTNNGVEESVRRYEPREALVGDTEFYTALVALALRSRAKGLVFEVGYESQVEHVCSLLPEWKVGSYYDSAGNIRCVVGWTEEMSELGGLVSTPEHT